MFIPECKGISKMSPALHVSLAEERAQAGLVWLVTLPCC